MGQRFKGHVRLIDGTEHEFECGNAAVAAWERYAIRNKYPIGQDAPPILSSIVAAHHVLGIEEGVDAWAELVDEIEVEAIDVPPTREEASSDS